MPTLLKAAVAGLLFAAAPALADSPFDGTWKADLASQRVTAKPSRFEIRNGTFRCATCLPTAFAVPADGRFHRVAGRPYWDEVAVQPVDDHRVTLRFRKDGREVSTSTDTVAADGRTMTSVTHNTNNGGNVPVDSTVTATRVGAPVAGAHLLSGAWQFAPESAVSDAALTMTMRVEGDRFHQETGLGETLDATIGGPYALNVNDPGRTMTKVERLGPRTLRFTDMSAGRVVGVSTFTVSDDGRTLTGSSRDPRTGNTSQFRAVKQEG